MLVLTVKVVIGATSGWMDGGILKPQLRVDPIGLMARTDFWKSNAKKFCDFCKCWIADNRPSIDFHENGKNHQQNVKRKISEVKKKAAQKRKDTEAFDQQLAAVEAAAMKAIQNDLQADPSAVGTTDLQSLVKNSNKGIEGEASTDTPGTSTNATWITCKTPHGYEYYYNKETGESRWEKPKELLEKSQVFTSTEKPKSQGDKVTPKSEKPKKTSISKQQDNLTAVETDKHPLLGGWTVVENPGESSPEDEEPESNATKASDKITDSSAVLQESSNPELLSAESRKRVAVFKEKTHKPVELTDSNESVGFKKRKVKNNRSTRKRTDED